MENLVTVDSIIGWMKDQVERKNPIHPSTWIDAAQKLNILLGDENGKLFTLKQKVAIEKYTKIKNGDSVASAKAYIETLDMYREMQEQEAKVEQVQEQVRIAKIQSKLSDGELKGY